jgi:hypothetical protein
MQNIAFAFPSYYRPIAVVTLLALLAWATGLPSLLSIAQAANVKTFSDTLSDSNPGNPSLHTIEFESINPWTAGQTFRIYFTDVNDAINVFDLSPIGTITASDIDVQGFTPVFGSCANGTNNVLVTINDNYLQGTVCGTDVVATGTIEIILGDPLDSDRQIVNPVDVGSYYIRLSGGDTNPIADNGDTRVAIIDNVTVTASVETIFTFSIHGVGEGLSINGDSASTAGTSTATSVPFGVIAPGVPKVMAQELRVNTNAINGFAVTVFADQTLTSANGATIDPFVNGAPTITDVPLSWSSNQPAGVLGSPNTWGHWGLTTDDTTLSSTTINYVGGAGDANYVGDFINTPVEVFYHTTPVLSTSGQGIGSTTVAYKVQITTLQEAATDYTATLTYIATPVF